MLPALPRPEDIDLIVCDVDGTLLTDSQTVHPTTVSAFARLREDRPHLPVIIASGKEYGSCLPVRKALGIPTGGDGFPAIHGNGSLLHAGDGSLLEVFPLRRDVVCTILDNMRAHATFVHTAAETIYVNHEASRDWMAVARKYYGDSSVDSSSADAREALLRRVILGEVVVIKVSVCVSAAERECALREMRGLQHDAGGAERFDIKQGASWVIQPVAPGVDKAAALRALCAARGISMGRVLAFGDGENDASMLAAVGHGVAMRNAMAEAQRAAKYTAPSNNDGGVGVFLSQVYGFDAQGSRHAYRVAVSDCIEDADLKPTAVSS